MRAGVTEDIVNEALKTEEGKKSLPTLPKSKPSSLNNPIK